MKLDEFFAHWKQIRADLLSTVDQFTEDELNYMPYEGAWSVGEILLHIANAEQGWFRYGVTGEFDEWPKRHTLDNHTTFDEIRKSLKEGHDWTEAYMAELEIDDFHKNIELPWDESIPLGWIIWHVIEHEIHHRGELSLILGMLGREGLDV